MNEDYLQLKELFQAALERPANERTAFLNRACQADPALRAEVDALLAAHEETGYLDSAALLHGALPDDAALMLPTADESMTGQRIGPYKILRELGHGGMGTVYLARRDDDQFKKRVAIKLIRRGMDTDSIIRRFRHERQILASLDHPNIARLLDGGATEDGLPYLVLEYVEGQPIDEYCDRHQLSTTERLDLFRKVSAAVHFAHQNLVVHRDLKPGNILVTSPAGGKAGTPKLLDFGIAKILNPEISGQTIDPTLTAMKLMTPGYASPEQIRGEAITTASDVYSLGVILYELLTGHRPYHVSTRAPHEIARVICEEEPPKPSTAVTRTEVIAGGDEGGKVTITPERVARARNEQPGKLRRRLVGDLDNIVLMALRKEPARRYQSTQQFSEDIERYLKGLPIIGRKDTFTYRASKFIRRHKVGVAATALVLLSLIFGIVATAWQARAARQEREKAEAIKNFLEQMLNASNPLTGVRRNDIQETTITEVLNEAAKRLDNGEFSQQPEIKADLAYIIAKCYYGQGKYQIANNYMQKHVLLQRQLYSEQHPKMINTSAEWAWLLFAKGDLAEAEKLYRQVLPLMRVQQKKGNIKAVAFADALNNFGYLRRTQGDSKEAELSFRETLSISSQLPAEARYLTTITRSTLASTLADQGRFAEALVTAREAVAEYRQRGETNTPTFGFSLTVFSGFLTENGDYAEALASLQEAEAIFRRLLSPSNLWLGDNLRNQGIARYLQGNYDEALKQLEEAKKIYLQDFGKHYDHYPTVLIFQGLSLTKKGQPKEGEKLLREAVELRTASLPKEHYWVAVAHSALGECLNSQKRYVEAEELLLASYHDLKSTQGEQNPRTVEATQRVVALYEAWGKPDQAARFLKLLPD